MFNSGYNNFYPYQNINTKTGLFSLLKGKLNWSSILNNTQKTLNIINQAIPVFYQIKPMWDNTKTIFKIIGAVKDDNTKNTVINKKNTNTTSDLINNSNTNKQSFPDDNTPNFFL